MPEMRQTFRSRVVVIDIYHPELRDGRIDAIDRGMPDSQWVAQHIGRPVIKAFNNILAKSLLHFSFEMTTSSQSFPSTTENKNSYVY